MNKHLFREHSSEIRHSTNDNQKITNGMSEKVQILASNIYKEFERLISAFGADVVEYLMPLVVNVLENLEELYQRNETAEAELELLRDDHLALNRQYEKDKSAKKQAEERALLIEYAYEEEKKHSQEKLLTSESVIRMLEMKLRNSTDLNSRLEEKVQSLKVENQKLYDKYTDILKSHAEQLNRIKAETYREVSPVHSISQLKSSKISNKSDRRESKSKIVLSSGIVLNDSFEIDQTKRNSNISDGFDVSVDPTDKLFTSGYISHEEETMADILANDQWITDFSVGGNDLEPIHAIDPCNDTNFDNNTGFFVDARELMGKLNKNNSLELTNIDSDTDVTDDEYGIGKEIDSLIRENQELVATKNALNIVKDDLISRLDMMTSENDVLREDLTHLSNREADLKGKLAHLEQELKACKEELQKKKESENSMEKSFSRGDLAILLEERNHFKEKLMELQDALMYKEMCRVKKQFPEYIPPVKPVKQNNSIRSFPFTVLFGSLWVIDSVLREIMKKFNHLFKKEDEYPVSMEKSKDLLSRFKCESDRSQLYSWSVPRSLIESTLPKRIPIPITIHSVFEPRDLVICATCGYEESQVSNIAQYIWCLVQSNLKHNKNYYLLQMNLTEKVPELTTKYSINFQFSTIPYTVTEVPALTYVAKDLNSLRIDDISKVNLDSFDRSFSEEKENGNKIYQTKVQMKQKMKLNIGSKTLWFGCEKNQIVIFVLLDNNKVENRMASLTIDSEIDFIRYYMGRIFVIEKNGSLGVFELNKEMNQWELNQYLLINVSNGLPISDSCCDVNTLLLWIGSSTNCFLLNLVTLSVDKSLPIMESSCLTDQCTSIESMVIVRKYSLMLFSVSRIGILLGYDLKTYKFKVSMDLKPSVFDLIEPVHGIEKSTLSLYQLVVDDERIWMTTDCGIILVVTLETLHSQLKIQASKNDQKKCSLLTEKIYISSHAFAQCVKILSLLSYTNPSLGHENSNSQNKNETKRNKKEESVNKTDVPETKPVNTTYNLMTAIGASYVNLNNLNVDVSNASHHAIVWKI